MRKKRQVERVFQRSGRQPAQLHEHLGEEAYAALNEEERKGWWLRLPEFPEAPPEAWTQA